jgi:hypothetical protein
VSFELSRTPTIEAVANEDEKRLAQDLEARAAEAVGEIQALEEVAAAAQAMAGARQELAKLRGAERALTAQVKESRERLERLTDALLEELVEAAAGGPKPEPKRIAELAVMEHRQRLAARAIERLNEHRIPLAEIAALREEAHALMTEARATERAAQERAERVLGQIREAVNGEMVLPIDLSKGVAGALLARARELKTRAVKVSENADRLERAYQDRYGKS